MNIVTIPREIQLLLFGQLSVLDLVRVSQTCHRLKEVARDPSLWKKLTLTYESTPLLKWPIGKNCDPKTGILHIVRDP